MSDKKLEADYLVIGGGAMASPIRNPVRTRSRIKA